MANDPREREAEVGWLYTNSINEATTRKEREGGSPKMKLLLQMLDYFAKV
jgi:hypothetical protein